MIWIWDQSVCASVLVYTSLCFALVFVCVYVYVYTWRVFLSGYTHTHTHSGKCVYMHVYIHVYTHIHVQMYAYTYMYMDICMYVYMCIQKSWFAYMFMYGFWKHWLLELLPLSPSPSLFLPPSLAHVPALSEIRMEFMRLNQSEEQANFFLNDFDDDKTKSLDTREFEVCACTCV